MNLEWINLKKIGLCFFLVMTVALTGCISKEKTKLLADYPGLISSGSPYSFEQPLNGFLLKKGVAKEWSCDSEDNCKFAGRTASLKNTKGYSDNSDLKTFADQNSGVAESVYFPEGSNEFDLLVQIADIQKAIKAEKERQERESGGSGAGSSGGGGGGDGGSEGGSEG